MNHDVIRIQLFWVPCVLVAAASPAAPAFGFSGSFDPAGSGRGIIWTSVGKKPVRRA